MAKREISDSAIVITKRQKIGFIPNTIFGLGDLLKNIASNLAGEDLLHFKLLNKICYFAARDMDCKIHIGCANFEVACSIRGYHYISLRAIYEKDEGVDLKETNKVFFPVKFQDVVVENIKGQIQFPNVEYLTIDYDNLSNNFTLNSNILILTFSNLKELRIIRAKEGISLNIMRQFVPEIRRLSVYTTSYVDLAMDRDLEEIRLYSQLKTKTSFRIHVAKEIDDGKIRAYGGGFMFDFTTEYLRAKEVAKIEAMKKKYPNKKFSFQPMPRIRQSLSSNYRQFIPKPEFVPK